MDTFEFKFYPQSPEDLDCYHFFANNMQTPLQILSDIWSYSHVDKIVVIRRKDGLKYTLDNAKERNHWYDGIDLTNLMLEKFGVK